MCWYHICYSDHLFLPEVFENDPSPETLQLGGVFGLEIPDEYGGLGYTMTEAARVLEAMAGSSHFQTTLVHSFLVQVRQQFFLSSPAFS